MDLIKILFIISVTIGASVCQERLYTPPFPSEAIEAANSILTSRARPIDDNVSPNKFNLSEGILNGSLITPPGEGREEGEEVIDENATTMINDVPALEEFNDVTGGFLKKFGKPFGQGYETNNIQEDEEDYLVSLGRAIGGGGVPGADFPILYKVPETGFSCGDGSLVGYYADMDPKAACQVFHICQEDGRHDSFLCPIGTLFNQKYFVCDWWYNVNCSSSAEFYSLNELLLRENANRGLKNINFNLKNRTTESFEEILEKIRNVKTDSKLFANKFNTGSKLFSNLNSTTEVDDKFEENDKGVSQSREGEEENLGLKIKNGKEEIEEEEEVVDTEVAGKVEEKEKTVKKGSEKEKKEQKGDKEGNKEGDRAVEEEKDENPDNEMKIEVVEGDEEKSESATEKIEEDRISNKETPVQSEQERRKNENFNKAKKDSVENETKITAETAKESNKKANGSKKEVTKSNDKYKDSKKENTTTNKANRLGSQNGSETSKLEEPFETPAESKDNKGNGIKKNEIYSTPSKSEVPSEEEVKGYTYSSKDGTEIENILNKRNPSLNSYGVVTDNLVNKKGIRN